MRRVLVVDSLLASIVSHMSNVDSLSLPSAFKFRMHPPSINIVIADANPTLHAPPNPRKDSVPRLTPPARPLTPAVLARDFPIPVVSASNLTTSPMLPWPNMVKLVECLMIYSVTPRIGHTRSRRKFMLADR